MSSNNEINFGSKRPKVLVLDPKFPEIAHNILKEHCDVTICEKATREELLEKVKGMEGLLWSPQQPLDKEILDAAGNQLRALVTKSVGFDHVDLKEIKRRNLSLECANGIPNDSTAELAIGLAIAAGRRFHEGRLKIENSQWEKRPQWLLGVELKNSTVGIVGFGGIGSTIARRLLAFDLNEILYSGPAEKPIADKLGAKFVSFDELCKRSDFIFVACPLNDSTRHLFNAEVFAKMKPNAVLINVSRGDVIDQEALYDTLKNNKIFAAGLDVTTPEPLPADHPLLKLPNCTIVPHLGTATLNTRTNMAVTSAKNLLKGLAGDNSYAQKISDNSVIINI